MPTLSVALPDHELLLWGTFAAFIVVSLAVDLRLGAKRDAPMSLREAGAWSLAWISLAAAFAAIVGHYRGRDAALVFVTGFLVEKALSVDNLFIFIMVFSYFGVRPSDQPRVLQWGILGAVVFRGALILAGRAVVSFSWAFYIFALLLVWAAWKMLVHDEHAEIHPEKNAVLRVFRRFLPTLDRFVGHRFFVRENGRIHGTALFVVLVVIESTDVVFALDSIPAIFGITQDLFLIFTSNVFAILGLRALFFVLAGIMDSFRFLKPGVAAILFFIAAKMVLKDVLEVPIGISLGVIGGILAAAVLASIAIKPRARPAGGGLLARRARDPR